MSKQTILFFLGIILCLSACNRPFFKPEIRVLVVESLDENYPRNDKNHIFLKDEFIRYGYDPQFKYIYANGETLGYKYWQNNMGNGIDNLSGWHPDIILVNGSFALEQLNLTRHQLLYDVPIVYSGVSYIDSASLHEYPHETGFVSVPDYYKNLKFAVFLSDCKIIFSILGQNNHNISYYREHKDSIILADINLQLKDKPILNNSQWKYSWSQMGEYSRDSIVYFTFDVHSPEKYVTKDGTNLFWDIFVNTSKYSNTSFLQVKHDLQSTGAFAHGMRHLFSVDNLYFDTPESNVLGGYFTDVETQFADMVSYADKILKGEKAENLPVKEHNKFYFVDYKIMKKLNIKFTDLQSDTLHMVNVPDEVKNPYFTLMRSLAAQFFQIIILVLFFYFVIKYFRLKKRLKK